MSRYARCNACSEECKPYEADFGIGAYEFWGAKGIDSRTEFVSNCCDADFDIIECDADEYDSRPEYWDALGDYETVTAAIAAYVEDRI